MFLSRFLGRTALLAAAKSESSAATAAAAAAAATNPNPLEQFFEADRNPDDEKPVYGRSWKASELRLKSWDDLHKLWYVMLKEKNMLMTQRQMLHAQNLRFPNPERMPKVLWVVGQGWQKANDNFRSLLASDGLWKLRKNRIPSP